MLRSTQVAACVSLAVAGLLVCLSAAAQQPPADKKPPAATPEAKLQELIKAVDDAAKQLQDAVTKGDKEGIAAATKRLAEARQRLEEARKQADAPPAKPMVPNLPALGRLGRGQEANRLGARLEAPSETLINQLNLPKGQGLLIGQVTADSAAAKAGLQATDILLEFAGKPVSSDPAEFAKALAQIKPNDPVTAVVLRKGQKTTIKGIALPTAAPAAPLADLPSLPQKVAVPGSKGQAMVIGKTDGFTCIHRDGKLMIVIVADSMDLKTIDEIKIIIRDGADMDNYDSVDDVPAQYRPTVKFLVEQGVKRMQAEANKP
jgi:membrane-associated protease RseP (regulator of RpoE activity)